MPTQNKRESAAASLLQHLNIRFSNKHYLAVSIIFICTHIALSNEYNAAPSIGAIWLVGAISVSLSYTFGCIGFMSALIAMAFSQHLLGYPNGLGGAFASLVFTSTITATVLFLTKRHSRVDLTNRLLPDSNATGYFIVYTIACAAISVALYLITLSLTSSAPLPTFGRYAEYTLLSSLALITLCPTLSTWKERKKWPRLPDDPKEYALWCLSLITLSFLAFTFGRVWLSICALLVIWSAARFSWFGACLGISISYLFVNPASHPPVHLGGEENLPLWLTSNIEPLIWFGICAASLYFASLLADKRRSERTLEQNVKQRTRALDITNNELKREIQNRREIESSLEKTNKRYKALIDTAGIPVIAINKNYVIEHWNGAAFGSIGHTYTNALGKDFLRLCIPEEQHKTLTWHLNHAREYSAQSNNSNQNHIETHVHTADGKLISMLWNISFVADEDLEEHGQFLMIGQDISSIKETQNQLHYLAHFDTLTGAANRRLFEDRCKQSIERNKRYDTSLALLSIDIDHFKRINDTLGHDGGDEFLVTLVQRLQQAIRKEDTVARLGGDEFAILLPNVSGQDGAELAARNILKSITQPVNIKASELIVTSSIGITLCPADGSDYEKLLKNADMAMYKAKSAGRNNIQFYCEDMNSDMIKQLHIEKELRAALNAQQFELHYQPIIDTKSGEIVALEALMRWRHPERGLILPDEFLAVADQSGLLQDIGAWSINQLCVEGGLILKQQDRQLPIAFNLTRRQYNHPSLLKMLSEACENHRFNPKKLILELSESTLTQAGSDTISNLRKLKRFGCAIAIDSFGTGTSSLSQLNSLPIDIIKIDRSFMAKQHHSKKDRMIVEALLAITKQLGIKSFAAGVETRDQEKFLLKNHCHYAQGFLYSQALPIKPLINFLSKPKDEQKLNSGNQITLPFSDADN